MVATTASTAPTAIAAAMFEMLDRHDLDGLAAHAAADITEDWPVVGHLEGLAAVNQHFASLLAALPDFRIEALRMAADGETVFVHWRATGTFSGSPFAGIRATGRAIDLRGTDCFTIRDGRVVGNFVAFDGMAFAVQAGVLPGRGSRADRLMMWAVNLRTRLGRLLRR